MFFYFLRHFFFYSSLFFVIITGILGSCNLVLRVSFLHNFKTIPLIFWTMLPLMAMFSLPLASSVAVYSTILQHKIRNEFLVLAFLKPAQRVLCWAVVVFSLLCGLAYLLLAFQFAPQSYKRGKQLLLQVAKEHILKLEPNKFHTPFPSVTFFFKKKDFEAKRKPVFSTLLLIFTTKKKERYFFAAQKGFFVSNKLFLYNGSIYTFKNGRFYTATFKQTEIDLNRLMNSEDQKIRLTDPKFFTWKNLLSSKKKGEAVAIEFHKRIAQTLWQFLLPMLVFFLVSIMEKGSFIAGILMCGSSYILSYVLVSFARAYSHNILQALLLFYSPILLIIALMFALYWRRKKIF